MRRIGAVLSVVGALAGMAVGAASADAAEPIRIGAIFSVTGPAAFLGEPERNTAKMLEEDLNREGGLLGRKIELIIYDDESDTTKAVTAVDRLIKRDRVVAIVGPSTSGSTLAIVPKVEEAKIPLISCAAGRKIVEPVRRWVFKVAASDILAVKKIFRRSQAAGPDQGGHPDGLGCVWGRRARGHQGTRASDGDHPRRRRGVRAQRHGYDRPAHPDQGDARPGHRRLGDEPGSRRHRPEPRSTQDLDAPLHELGSRLQESSSSWPARKTPRGSCCRRGGCSWKGSFPPRTRRRGFWRTTSRSTRNDSISPSRRLAAMPGMP